MPVAARPAVLVVDDSPEVRAVLGAMLASHGFDPRLAASGEEGVAVYRRTAGQIAAAVLDVQMPGMDGPATLDALRRLAPGLPCVFVTGDSGAYTERDLLARGAAAVLTKPVSPARLGAILGGLIGITITRPEGPQPE